MDKYIKNKKIIIELGSGNGCLKRVLKQKKIILTDIIKYPWIDKKLDMLKIDLNKKYPNRFLKIIRACSKPTELMPYLNFYKY